MEALATSWELTIRSPDVEPGLILGPMTYSRRDREVIVFAFSNMSKATIAASQDPKAKLIIEATRDSLNLSDELAGSGLGWHTYFPRLGLDRAMNDLGQKEWVGQ